MPTITPKPQWGARYKGFASEPSMFDAAQLAELAELLGYAPDALSQPLDSAGAAIWRWQYSKDLATPREQRAALAAAAQTAESLRSTLSALDDTSRRRLLAEYSNAADLDTDMRALDRLAVNLAVSQRRITVDAKRPENVFQRVAAEKLIEAYEQITNSRFVSSKERGKRAARLFVLRALEMMGIDPKTADGAIRAALKKRGPPK
jgi:hypothetical protein